MASLAIGLGLCIGIWAGIALWPWLKRWATKRTPPCPKTQPPRSEGDWPPKATFTWRDARGKIVRRESYPPGGGPPVVTHGGCEGEVPDMRYRKHTAGKAAR